MLLHVSSISCTFFLHLCPWFFWSIKKVWFLLLFWRPSWISHYLPRRVGLLRTLQLPWKLRAKGPRRVHRWCLHCPLQLGDPCQGYQSCGCPANPPNPSKSSGSSWFSISFHIFQNFRFGVHFSFQDKAISRPWKILEYFMEWWGLLIDVAVCSWLIMVTHILACLACLALFGPRSF